MTNIYAITGCAGFIGSNLVDRLLYLGHKVIGIDNFSTGQRRFIKKALNNHSFQLIEGDILNLPRLKIWLKDADFVFHLAANADVRFGTEHPDKDLQQNTIATFNVLEAMRHNNIKKILFSSSSSIYGKTTNIPTPENEPFPIQTSLYGASKLACEGLIEAYCEGFEFQSWVFRLVSILGERYTHGHVYDFYRMLLQNPNELLILGDGSQKKSYLYVQDCLDAMLFSISKFKDNVNILNLGTKEYCQVSESVTWVTAHLGLNPKLKYSVGNRGWIGDNPFTFLDTSKINNAGWKPKISIKEAIIKTLLFLQDNHWVLNIRG